MALCPSCGSDAGDVARFCPSCGAPISRTLSGVDPMIGRVIAGKFRIESLLGEGGMGMVYKATQVNLEKAVVLKVLRPSLMSDERTVARFQREAKAASRLNHPNSIGVIDFGQAADDGSMYIAMEYCPGKDLHHILNTEWPLDERRISRIVSQVLSALAEAHAHGVIHRDLKPENIMVEQRRGDPDFVKVLDFGIAKIQDSTGESDGQALTRQGFVCGTPEYMSPEQAKGASIDHRSDLYAVGVILYQMVTGLLPFDSESAVGFATAHLTQEPPPLRRRRPDCRVSPGLERLIMKSLSKDPAMRPQSAEVFRAELMSLAPISSAYTVATAPHTMGHMPEPGAPETTQVGEQPWSDKTPSQGLWNDRTPSQAQAHAWSDTTPADARQVATALKMSADVMSSEPQVELHPEGMSETKPQPRLQAPALVRSRTQPDAVQVSPHQEVAPQKPSAAPKVLLAVGALGLLVAGGYYVYQHQQIKTLDIIDPPEGTTGVVDRSPKPIDPVHAPTAATGPEVSLSHLPTSNAPGDVDEPKVNAIIDVAAAKKDARAAKQFWSDNKMDEALVLYRKAYQENPRDPEVLHSIGLIYQFRQDRKAASFWLRKYKDQLPAKEQENVERVINDLEKPR